MSWIVCAYFTNDAIYRKHSENLVESCKKWNIPHDVVPITPFNDWNKGMQYKPYFLRDMLRKYPDKSVLYVDADAIFCKYPEYLNNLDVIMKESIALHILDHTKYRRKNQPPEVLSGTIFLRNTQETSIILQEWILEMDGKPNLWDQRALATVIKKHNYFKLPEEYCVIYDYMASVADPVIKHFQASRTVKRAQAKRKEAQASPRPKVIQNNQVIKLGRVNNQLR